MISFIKMHGCANDYIYIDCFAQTVQDPQSFIPSMSDRHTGVGGDGVVLICPSDVADGQMRMFNADGSEGKMCGNAIRCVGKYLYESGLVHKNPLTIETLSGIKTLNLHIEAEEVTGARVDMGPASFVPADIPVVLPTDIIYRGAEISTEGADAATDPTDASPIIQQPLIVNGTEFLVTCVSMGNPHCVVFCDDPDAIDIEKIGPLFEHHQAFPEGINTEFVQVLDDTSLKMRVWERGSGETQACGTGACAAVAASVASGFCKADTDVKVFLRGGVLTINYTEQTVFLEGNAVKVFEGVCAN